MTRRRYLKLVEVAIVGAHEGSRSMLERRIGGILKNIAHVFPLDLNKKTPKKIDLIVAHTYGGSVQSLEEKFVGSKVIGIDLVLLPQGVRELMTYLKRDEKVGVIAEHLKCANYLMCEIIKSGIAHVHFVSGTFNQVSKMKVDRFIVAEEMAARVPEEILNSPQLLMVPRMVSPYSSAQLINLVLEIASISDTQAETGYGKVHIGFKA